MTEKAHPCLYCGLHRRFTDEHVLQRGFKTNLVLKDRVCHVCNTEVFGPLDDKLVKFVRTYVYPDHPHVRPDRTLLHEGHQLWFSYPGADEGGLGTSDKADCHFAASWFLRSQRGFDVMLRDGVGELGNRQWH